MAINNLSNPFEIEEYNRRQKEQLLQLMTPGQKANAARGQMAMQSPRLDSNINMPLSAKQQLAIQATQNADIPGMDQILGAKTTTLGTALAKTLAAGASSYYGRKDNAEKASVLTKALQAKENAIGAEERAALDVALQERLKDDARWEAEEKRKNKKVYGYEVIKENGFDVTYKTIDGEITGDPISKSPSWKTDESSGVTGNGVQTINTQSNVIVDMLSQPVDVWLKTTGKFDPRTPAARFAPGVTNNYDEDVSIQTLFRQINRLSADGAGPVLEILGDRPTDFDAKFALKSSITPDSEPGVIADWIVTELAPTSRDALINYGFAAEGKKLYDEYINSANNLKTRISETTKNSASNPQVQPSSSSAPNGISQELWATYGEAQKNKILIMLNRKQPISGS